MSNQYRLKSTVKYPTSLIVNGVSNLGLEIADSLLAQGGYVILIDSYNEQGLQLLEERLGGSNLVSFLDYSAIPHLEEDMRRLDYVFYLGHEEGYSPEQVSTQTFLKYSNYLDTTLSLAGKFEAKFLLTTSIKAHQMLMSRMDFDVNFGTKADSKHSVYTEMEVQRYAESLCMEYVTKTDLNARIVRLGDIIGEGMDFSPANNAFVNLVLAAIRGEELSLAGDGLETEWFVHLLDAAYGVIKAQFSKNTKGDIFSLAYENSVTHLSLAYKLQELEPLAREINFHEAEMSGPPLRFHKPAPNLSKIGWKPRIDFDKAIAESLAAAKLYVLSSHPSSTGALAEPGGVVGKLKSFFAVAEHAPTPAELEMLNSGPVSRLIAERKRQEQARIDSLGKADAEIKSKWRDRPRTPAQRAKAWVWRNFLDVRTNFNFLRNMTPGQFLFYSILLVVGIWAYFAVISPVVVVARNVVVAYGTLPELEKSLAEYDFGQVYGQADRIQAGLRESSQLIQRFMPAAEMIAADKYLDSMIGLTEVYADAFEGLRDLSYAVAPLGDYLADYQDNVWARGTAESYLSVNDTGRDYSPVLDEMTARSAYADVGVSKYQQAVLQMQNLDISVWPGAVQNILQKYTQKLTNLAAIANYRQIADYANEILGLNAPMTYLVLLVDNTRVMPIGGEISAYMLVTVQNGAIADIRVQSIDNFEFSAADVPDYALSSINLVSAANVQAGNVSMHDLAKIKDYDIFSQAVSQMWGTKFNRQVDAVLVVDYSVLADMLDLAGGVEIEGQAFN
ncbi:DUF4012 domain-containing protein, partial [Candidatus Dojkabacteria bacterium]|nr:DUF4012 domain-containing protein [Candidatus Dojkabacteria bacterium]